MKKRKSYRDYLRINGIPLRYDFKNENDIQKFRNNSCSFYNELYKDLSFTSEDIILEVGSHYGAFVQFLNSKGIKPDAIDLDSKKIDYLKSLHNLSANFIAGNAMNVLKSVNEKYDYVFLNFVLEHIKQDELLDLLRMLQKTLKIGGKIYVLVPNMENPFNLRLRYMEPTHCNGFTTETIIWALYMGGFDEIKCLDPNKYSKEKLERIKNYFSSIEDLFEIRKFHSKYSESIMCFGEKKLKLEEIEFGPYDY